MKKIGFLCIIALGSTACSQYTSNGERYYLQNRNGASLVVPPPLTNSNISQFYALPPQNQNPRVSIEPPSDPSLERKLARDVSKKEG